jgi:hypothetical protein
MLLALLTLLSVSAPEPARAAITVLYVATDVEDAGAGDRWRYDYVVQGAYLSPAKAPVAAARVAARLRSKT